MTDTASPITGPMPSPMFDTGPQDSLAPNTEPHPAPIFDTGPHPGPLQPLGAQAPSDALFVEDRVVEDPVVEDPLAEEPVEEHVVEESAEESAEEPVEESVAEAAPEMPVAQAFSESESVDTDAFLRSVTGHLPPVVIAAQPVSVPGSYQFVKRWHFGLILAGVWVLAAAAGLGFYFWWYTSLDKTLPVLGILLFVVAAMVASLLVSMIPNRPQLTALAIVLMAVPCASVAAAAVLHGAYYFEWIARPAIG